MFGPEVNGQMTLAPIKLVPAGTALFEPILPVDAYSDIQKPRLKLYIVTDKDDPTPWLKGLWASSVDNAGAFVQRRKDLRPNMRQSLHVPADVRMSLLLYGPHESHHAPLIVTDVMVKQGQTLDLGRLEFGPGVTVTVKVVDSAGNPVKAMRLHCMDAHCGDCGLTAPTSRDGTTQVHVAPSTQGRFVAYCFGRSSQDRMEASVAYEIAGPEDNGREFVLQLPDAFIERLREADRERQQEAMPIQPLPASRYPAGSRR
jgi:hypothetical protein